ncbi:MAG: hypothetical protein M3O71_23805 [Bacteroidota bacterium]|nr:hypothetical protein [Bacteroidota bacterium]
MPQQTDIQQLVRTIAEKEFPNEAGAYDAIEEVAAGQLFNDDLNAPDIVAQGSGKNPLVIGEIGTIISSLSVLIGTVKTYYEIVKLKRDQEKNDSLTDDLETRWMKELKKAGLTAEVAESLSKKYHKDLKKVIKEK